MIDVTVPADKYIFLKEFQKLLKYKDLEIEVTKMWKLKIKKVQLEVGNSWSPWHGYEGHSKFY